MKPAAPISRPPSIEIAAKAVSIVGVFYIVEVDGNKFPFHAKEGEVLEIKPQ